MSRLLKELDYLIEKYQSEVNTEELREQSIKLEKEFHEKYSLEKIKSMSLEDYALGASSRESFCWWMEYYSRILGSIKGGNAKKHIIYFSKDKDTWIYPEQFENVNEAWDKLRNDYVELIENAGNDKGIESTNLLFNSNMLKTKTLYLFYPSKFLPIYSIQDMQEFLEQLNIDKQNWHSIRNNSIVLNQLLKSTFDKLGYFKGWHPVVIMNFIYKTLKKSGTKYIKIAPGENARLWEQCKNGGYISIGWSGLGDMSQFPEYSELKRTFEKNSNHQNKSKITEKANEAWLFYSLEPGDKIIVNKGTSQIIGMGTVINEGYKYRDELPEYKHTVSVEWDEDFNPITIPEQKYWAFKTVYEVEEKLVTSWLGNTHNENGENKNKVENPPEMFFSDKEKLFFDRIKKAIDRKGQCILYGPPGTGKTYMARKFAAWSIGSERGSQEFIKISTFHPSYTYEDFIEGFKPISKNNGHVAFELENGIFKQFCLDAKKKPDVPFYFIIDELNRGNVPKIFGELITMLEKDKRGVEIILPQSKKAFSIPSNVYIIATMNTSDRSIKMMDAALKRRFAFIECLPNYELIDQVIDELSDSPATILSNINVKLIEKGGRDKQIGHSYFMNNGEQLTTIQELKEVFEFEIIPLLQEYCFDNYEELAYLIGNDFIDLDSMSINSEVFSGQNDFFINAINTILKG